MATVDGAPSTAWVLIRLEPEVLGAFASKGMGLRATDEAVRADEEASYTLAEAEVRQ